MTPKLRDLVDDAVANETPERLALGWVRYEALRRVSPPEFERMWRQSVRTQQGFDGIVDRLACQDVTRGGGK